MSAPFKIGQILTASSLNSMFETPVVNVLGYGATGNGATDDTAAINAAIAACMGRGGGVVFFPGDRYLMLGALNIPYDGTTNPTQPPLRLMGVGANYGWNGLPVTPPLSGGTILDMRYGGGDSFGHVAKIDTRGIGTLEIDGITFVDGGTSNYLFIQTTNTVLKVSNCRFVGNTANVGQTCTQDAIRLGGITSAASQLKTDDPLDGFQGYGSYVKDCQFDYIRETVQFGGACNGVTVSNCTVTRQCGSGDAIGAPYHFYGVAGGTHGNIISGGFVEMINYPYAVAMIGSAINRNVIQNLGMYDEAMASPTLGGVYFDTGATLNVVYVGFTDGPLQPTVITGPGQLQNTLINPSGISVFSLSVEVGKQTGNSKVIIQGGNTNANDGAQLQLSYGGIVRGIIGNYSAVKGGAYDAHLTLYGGALGIVLPDDRLGVLLGDGVFPTHTLEAGDGTGSQKMAINGGNSATGDGSAIVFENAGTEIGRIGNYSSAGFGGAYNRLLTLYGATHGILIPGDNLGIATGNALNAVGAEVGIGDGTGKRRIVINGGNTGAADGSLVLFYNNNARVGGVGSASTYFNTAYATYGRSTLLAGYDVVIFSTHDVEAGRIVGTTGTQRWLINTQTDDTTSLLQVAGNINGVGGVYKISGTQVVSGRQTGWAAMTGTPDISTAFDTSTVTTSQLAERVLSLQAALTTHGLIGP